MYTKDFDDIREICESLSGLEPGEKLRIGPLENVSYVRWKIYSYLHEVNLKKFFVVKMRRNIIEVERRETEFKIEKVKGDELPEKLSVLLEKALLAEKKGEGREFIQSLYQNKELSLAELGLLLERFLEVEK